MTPIEKQRRAAEILNQIKAEARGDWTPADYGSKRRKTPRVAGPEQIFEVITFEPFEPERIEGLDLIQGMGLLSMRDDQDAEPLDPGRVQQYFCKLDQAKFFQTADGTVVKIKRIK
jgi:hypothetical protein